MVGTKIKIALAVDPVFLREGLSNHLNNIEGYTVVLNVSDIEGLLAGLAGIEKLPDFCILGTSEKIFDGFRTLNMLQNFYPTIKLIALSDGSPEETIIEKFYKYGIKAFLTKDSSLNDLKNVINSFS